MPWLHSAAALLVCCVLIFKKDSHSFLLTVTIVFSIDSEDVPNPSICEAERHSCGSSKTPSPNIDPIVDQRDLQIFEEAVEI